MLEMIKATIKKILDDLHAEIEKQRKTMEARKTDKETNRERKE